MGPEAIVPSCADDLTVWAGDREFVPRWFLVEFAGIDDAICSSADDVFKLSIQPALALLRTPTVHQSATPAGGVQCFIDSPDASLVVRVEPAGCTIEVRTRSDLGAACGYANAWHRQRKPHSGAFGT